MPYCSECGKKNEDDAKYCTKCGSHIAKSSDFEKDIDQFAEEFGRKAEEFGKRMEKKAKEFAKSMEEHTTSKTKDCPECKEELDCDANFCWKCGKEV